MSGFICARCLARPLTRPTRVPVANVARFTTSPRQSANDKAGKNNWQSKGNKAVKVSRVVAPGERKAARKRVVLSNVNARAVNDLAVLDKVNASGSRHQGQMLALPDDLIDALRANEAFKATQEWHLFQRPATLMREDTKRIASLFDQIESGSEPTVLRRILSGPRGSGKSILQLQAMSMALLKGWITIHIPDTNAMTNGSTSYAPDGHAAEGEQQSYIQPTATSNLLAAISESNKPLLSTLQLSQTHTLPIPIQPNMSLYRFAQLGVQDKQLAWPIYSALWRELTTAGRPRILFTVDGASHFLRETGYTGPDLRPIHALDLRLPRQAVDLLTGNSNNSNRDNDNASSMSALPNGGLVLVEDSMSNRPSNVALDFAARRARVLAAAVGPKPEASSVKRAIKGVDAQGVPAWNPLVAVDRRAMDVLVPSQGQDQAAYEIMDVGGMSREETKGVMEYYARSGLFTARIDAALVGEKWTLSGGGIIGEVERACLARA